MTTDPRRIPGSITGPGGPHDHGSVILDARRAILMDDLVVSTVDKEHGSRGQFAVAAAIGGRINQTGDRASVLVILNSDAVAALITELVAVLGRASKTDARAVLDDLVARIEKLDAEGNLR
jgi:hypothetical protein